MSEVETFETDLKEACKEASSFLRDNPVIGTIYLKKSILKKEPKKIKVAIEWEKCDKCFITSNAQSGIRVPFFMSHV